MPPAELRRRRACAHVPELTNPRAGMVSAIWNIFCRSIWVRHTPPSYTLSGELRRTPYRRCSLRIHLPRRWVNRGRSLGYSHRSSSMSWITAPPGGGPSPAANERDIRPLVASPDSTVFTASWVTSTPWLLSRS